MLTRIRTAVYAGIEGQDVIVETDVGKGIPKVNIVGLPSTAVRESTERIKSAIINSGLSYPRGRITINLAPANIRKQGSHLDLAIAIGLLATSLEIDCVKAEQYGIIGELALDGDVVGVDGVLPMVICMAKSGIGKVIVPRANYNEASLVEGVEIIPVNSLEETCQIINEMMEPARIDAVDVNQGSDLALMDFSEIHGQENAKRAIVVAATGRHGMIMIGSPGCGKTMLSRRIPTIMPPMTSDESLETSIIYSVAGKLRTDQSLIKERPFRSPHSTIGVAGLIGGGAYPVPGELSLAHNGVLFLDEICEFSRRTIESLRLPVEDKTITHFRNGRRYQFPCDFQLVMAANPCKCGYYGNKLIQCKCSPKELQQYRHKLSGPMMDRIDIRIEMDVVDYEELASRKAEGMNSHDMRELVIRGRNYAKRMGRTASNANLENTEIKRWCHLGIEESKLMRDAYNRLKMSPRAYSKVLKVARTIADIDESEEIKCEHLAEAISYRILSQINEG